jgi:hypothetical protein
MLKIKQLFCRHNYKLILRRKSKSYTTDYINFSDLGMYDELLYKCTKCGKEKHKFVMNKEHPLYSKWEKVGEE